MSNYKISTLIFIQDEKDRFLMLKRAKEPCLGCWSVIGGKMHLDEGESPFECAIREAKEEAQMDLMESDLHLFGVVTEKAQGNDCHWLIFLFNSKKRIKTLPPPMSEGTFGFFSREEVNNLTLPYADPETLWPLYDSYKDAFVALKGRCMSSHSIELSIEETFRLLPFVK